MLFNCTVISPKKLTRKKINIYPRRTDINVFMLPAGNSACYRLKASVELALNRF